MKKLIALIKKEFSIPVAIGGPQVSAYPEQMLLSLKADFAIYGEGEVSFYELTKALSDTKALSSINGLVYRDEDSVLRKNPPRELVKNLDELPFPAWHLMPPDKYRIKPILSYAKRFPIAPIVTSRGCPYQCTFCGSNITWQHKIRLRSAQNVINEIEHLKKTYRIREIHITDDNFTFDQLHAREFCETLISRKIRISWQCPNGVRIDTLDKELLKLMKKAGCYSVGLGIESGNQEILNGVKKKLDLSKVRGVLKNLKQAGIRCQGFFILGLPNETKRTIQQTIEFALNNPFDRAYFGILTPYPGSEIFSEYFKDTQLNSIDWERFNLSQGILEFNDIKKVDLFQLQKKAIRSFYMRPKIFLDIIFHMRLGQLKTILMTHFFKQLFLKKAN